MLRAALVVISLIGFGALAMYGEEQFCTLPSPDSSPTCYRGKVPPSIQGLTRIRPWPGEFVTYIEESTIDD